MHFPRNSESWNALQQHFEQTRNVHMRDQFNDNRARFEEFSIRFNDILFDYSKNRIDTETINLLIRLAKDAGVPEMIEKMFSGEKINHTENRSVLHVALRNRSKKPCYVDGINIIPDVEYELARVKKLARSIRAREWLGATDQPITDVVNIGIGGSHLGPLMVTEALRPYALHDLNVHFVANIDENHINDTLENLKPETTLFIISSKSFTTQDTMVNAETARQWFLSRLPDEKLLAKHFVAVTENQKAANQFGIEIDNIFKMWDWVGGRYSLWSAIGLSIVISIGPENFDQLLGGAYDADQHFRDSPFEHNIPVIMALLGIWYNNFYGAQTTAVLPYAQHMHRFPAYLQQADMESNGKFIDRAGNQIDYSTGPILFGEIGIPSQHAFYQLLHQGTKLVPVDILAPIFNFQGASKHHNALMSNVFAQTEALMKGKTEQEVLDELSIQGLSEAEIEKLLPHKVFPGNRPSNTFLFETLNPKTLGSLIALYEHKIFVQGIIWNINSFDQWGVELGKHLANKIMQDINNPEVVCGHDSSTDGLINYYKSRKV
ncbi:glucose-6-phosphate isomerase [Aliikangiella coralliicola]|uniref:Glucose-6-phosphate isomerase n=1 Tax=Aliikangiella coralliicola TaxID=2592383 RepID=A0A545UJS8_9GAMM|nr:glucose-6-phosphate isomerase [Aliikangiella coralliicola]TQV89693.1 glucose-6-phosphate isomerase [Aliikangiella coralliicola]